MLTITGKPVCGAIGIAPLAVFRRSEQAAAVRTIENVEKETARFHAARQEAIRQLQALQDKAQSLVGEEDAAIFEIHQMMLEDDEYIEGVEACIREEKINAEAAADRVAQSLADMFRSMEDEYMQGRAADVLDVSRRVVRILSGGSESDLSGYDEVILAADDLAPSETMRLDTSRIRGFVLSAGSVTSHTAILARNLGIATVVNTGIPIEEGMEGQQAVVDGFTGAVYIAPDPETETVMQDKQRQALADKQRLEEVRGKESITLDGKKVLVYANAGNPADLPGVVQSDAEGIGLFRSEFLYLENTDYPTEEQQFNAYKEVLESMPGKRVVIRTLDIGADKKADYFGLEKEENPALGMRAIRICLTRPELFRTQLRALCRASVYGRLAIMFPMIISAEEVRRAKAILAGVRSQLDEEGLDYAPDIEIGIMVETPAAALISDALAKEVDFFSLGTNDLTQYTLAIDRQQTKLDEFFDPHHPAVLHLIRLTVENAHKAGIWAGICGEMAADLSLTETFLRMGVDELSVSPASVLALRDRVRSLRLDPQ